MLWINCNFRSSMARRLVFTCIRRGDCRLHHQLHSCISVRFKDLPVAHLQHKKQQLTAPSQWALRKESGLPGRLESKRLLAKYCVKISSHARASHCSGGSRGRCGLRDLRRFERRFRAHLQCSHRWQVLQRTKQCSTILPADSTFVTRVHM